VTACELICYDSGMRYFWLALIAVTVCASSARAQYPPIGQVPVSPPVTGYNAPYIPPQQQFSPIVQAPVWTPPVTGHPAPYMPGFGPPLQPAPR
jgi:hypothetical protein